ncbi:MAG: hypothetical protein WBW81_13610 [Methylocella sp.]
MNIGKYNIAPEIAGQLEILLTKEAQHPFREASAPSIPLENRLANAIGLLERNGLDWEAAIHAFAAVTYISRDEVRQFWQTAGSSLSVWIQDKGYNQKSDAYFLQIAHENHIKDLFDACNWPGRADTLLPNVVEDLWSYIDVVRDGTAQAGRIEKLRQIDRRRAWILLWDANLSGHTVSTEIRRIHRCMRMMPCQRDRQFILVGGLETSLAHNAVMTNAHKLGFDLCIICPHTISDGNCLSNTTLPSDAMRQRILDLCQNFHQKWILPTFERDKEKKRPLYRDIAPLGYRDGGLLLVRQENCPNNTLPFLWFSSDETVDPYEGPFRRNHSKEEHLSNTDPKLDELTDDDIDQVSLCLAYYLGAAPDDCRVKALPIQAWKKDSSRALSLCDFDSSDNMANADTIAQRLLRSAPTEHVKLIAEALLVRAGTAFWREDELVWRAAWSEFSKLKNRGIDLGPPSIALQNTLTKAIADQIAAISPAPPSVRTLRRSSLPESRYSFSGPPRALRLLAATPEPRTTRSVAASVWSSQLSTIISTGSGALWFVAGPPGWGKSIFVRMSARKLTAPILYVDLADAETKEDLAYALLAGCSDEEVRQAVDRNPLSAIEILGRYLNRPTLIIMEHVYRNRLGKPPAGLDLCLTRLAQQGHVIVVETWPSEHSMLSRQVESAVVHQIDRRHIVPIDSDEIRDWSRVALGYDLGTEEIDHLSILDGHPGKIRAVLEFLQLESPSSPEDIVDAILETAVAGRDTEYEGYIEQGTTPPHRSIPNDVTCWLAIFPWVEAAEELLSDPAKLRLRRLAAAGVITRNKETGAWIAGAWGQNLSWRVLISRPEILLDQKTLLVQLSMRVPEWSLRMQRRHIAVVMSRLAHADGREFLSHLLENSLPNPSAEPSFHQEAISLEPPAKIDSSIGVLSPDIAAWGIEGAARKCDVGTVRKLCSHLTTRLEESALYLQKDWVSLKALHTGFVALTASPAEKASLYELIVPVIARAIDGADDVARAWCVRLLTFAASVALFAVRHDIAAQWLQLAEGAQLHVPVPPLKTFARFLYDDTRYRILNAKSIAGQRYEDIAEANIRAIDAVPPIEHQSPASREQWGYRILVHSKPALRIRGADPVLLDRVATTFADLPPTLRWFDQFARFQTSSDELPEEAQSVLDAVFARKSAELRADQHADSRLTELANLLGRTNSLEAILSVIRRVTERVENGLDATDMVLFRQSLLAMKGRSNLSAGIFTTIAEACQLILTYLHDNAPSFAGDEFATLLRRQCLSNITQHHLAQVRIALRMDEDTETKGRTAIRRIVATYRHHAAVAMDPWLWDECAEAVIEAVSAHCLERKDPVETEAAIETMLDAVRGTIEAALPSHPVAHAAAIRIHRYQWHFKECLEHSLQLLKEPLIGRDRTRAVRLCERATRQLILEPPALRYWTAPEDQLPKLSGLYRDTLIETLSIMGRSAERQWAQAAIQVLDGKLDEKIADQLVKRVGQLERYWETLARASDAGEPDPELSGLLALVEDMTDSTAVGLISTLLRRGTLDTSLPISLREKLARGALISAIQTEMWERSIRGTPMVTTLLRVAFAVGIGLSLSKDGTLLESKTAPILSRKRGRPMLWRDFMRSRLDTARSRGVGRFRSFVQSVAQRLEAL